MELNKRTWRFQRDAIYVSVIRTLSFTPVALPDGVKMMTVSSLGMLVSIKEKSSKSPVQLLDSRPTSMLYTKRDGSAF